MTKTSKITGFRVSWTADHEQYYQGHGIVFTEYTHTGGGCGETLREAFEQALTSLYEQDVLTDEIMSAIQDDGLTLEAQIESELRDQVKPTDGLDWDIVRSHCPDNGNHSICTCGHEHGPTPETVATDTPILDDDCQHCECDEFDFDSENVDCAVCAGEWHFYVNVDVQVEGSEHAE